MTVEWQRVRVALVRKPTKRICADECGAQCCRAPGYFTFGDDELDVMHERAQELDVHFRILRGPPGMYAMDFANNGGACPFLDQETSLCRIYADRPKACRDFPTKWDSRCALFHG